MEENFVYGTKCASTPLKHKCYCETLGNIYREIIAEHGEVQLNKPRPGDHYRKVYNPLSDIDRPSFRRMPSDIQIVTPARLFRSTGYKYHGRIYLEAELYWEFQYRFQYGEKWEYDWMQVRLLSYCYIPANLVFVKPESQKFAQLSITFPN